MYFKLDENKNVVKSSIEEWSDFIEGQLPTSYKHVSDEIINDKIISTIFIGLVFDFSPNDVPLTFETMVFDKEGNALYQDRYGTWKDAEKGHRKAIEWVKSKELKHEKNTTDN